MLMFDLTPAGAFTRAVEIASEKDCRNARRIQTTAAAATPKLRYRVATVLRRALTILLKAAW